MIALSSLHFCPCDGRQAGLWYLPARWRYTTRYAVVYLSAADNCLAPKTGYNAPLSSHGEGAFCHDSTSILLSARGLRTPVAVCHAAPRLAQPRRDDPDKASEAHHAAPPALHRAQTVCGPDAQAPLCPV